MLNWESVFDIEETELEAEPLGDPPPLPLPEAGTPGTAGVYAAGTELDRLPDDVPNVTVEDKLRVTNDVTVLVIPPELLGLDAEAAPATELLAEGRTPEDTVVVGALTDVSVAGHIVVETATTDV